MIMTIMKMKTASMRTDSPTISPVNLSSEDLASLVEQQIAVWPEVASRYHSLGLTRRRTLDTGDLPTALQLNPARIVSTAADTSDAGIAARRCFLCASNRPEEQFSIEWLPDWDLCINPFPILPIHFTIIAKKHTPQSAPPLEMASMAEAAPDLCIFFNGAKGGASAPDHLHLQGVLKSELSLLGLTEKYHPSSRTGFIMSDEFGLDLPFHFVSAVITPDLTGMRAILKITKAWGIDEQGKHDSGLINVFFWMGADGLLRSIVIPRRRHRSHHYFLKDPERIVVAPGAIDMTGLLITPRQEDFDRIDARTLKEIYAETAFADNLPQDVRDHFKL